MLTCSGRIHVSSYVPQGHERAPITEATQAQRLAPTMGASPFGYKIAEQFGLKVWPTRAGLVPLTLHDADKEKLAMVLKMVKISPQAN